MQYTISIILPSLKINGSNPFIASILGFTHVQAPSDCPFPCFKHHATRCEQRKNRSSMVKSPWQEDAHEGSLSADPRIPHPETSGPEIWARRISEVKLVGELSFTDWCFIETWDIMKLDFESSNRNHMNAWFGWLKTGNQRILISTIQVQSFTQLWYCVGLKLVLPCLSKASDHVIHSKHIKLLHLGSFPCQQVHMQPIPSTYGRVLSWSTEVDSHAYNENPVFLI